MQAPTAERSDGSHGGERLGAPEPSTRPEAIVELMVLHATHQKRGIDARLRELPELTKGPFASFDTYRLLERVELPLQRGQKPTHRLPNGRTLGTELVALEKGGVARLVASISEPGGSAFLPLLEVRAKPGQRFIVAGQGYKNGILVLVLTLVAPSTPRP
jgi:hypothetical protein